MALWITKEDVSDEYKVLLDEEVNLKLEGYIEVGQNNVMSDLEGIIDAGDLIIMNPKPLTVLRMVRMQAQIMGLTYYYQTETTDDITVSTLRQRYKDLLDLLRSGDMVLPGTDQDIVQKGSIEIG